VRAGDQRLRRLSEQHVPAALTKGCK
jgi:hypothetical protein